MATMETLTFDAHQNLINHVISSQAGTLSKALLEAVMNSVDAGATKVIVNLDATSFNVNDDGRGFGSREEVLGWFKTFGTPHAEGDGAVYGLYRMGRGQLFSFASTVWRTGIFRMDVDTKVRGLEFDLHELDYAVKGCRIAGTLYQTLSTAELDQVTKEFVEFIRYCQIPVILNGHQVSKRPAEQKWDLETEDAYIKTSKDGELKVYNLGVLVRGYPTYTFGCGGVVVSKLRLEVNFARNDILTHKCEVWKRIRKYIEAQNIAKTSSKDSLTKDEREFLAREISYGHVSGAISHRVTKAKLLTDAAGRHHAIEDLARFEHIAVADEEQKRLGTRLQRSGSVLVLSKETLDRFRCSNLPSLLSEFQDRLDIAKLPVPIDFAKATETYSDEMRPIDELELSTEEQAALAALREVQAEFHRWFAAGEKSSGVRELLAGASDIADAWTDGCSTLHIERKLLARAAKRGAEGFFEALVTLVHEYCHDQADHGSHSHDNAFFSRHHDAIQYRSGRLYTLTTMCLKSFERRLAAAAART